MGLISDIFDFLSTFDRDTYIDESKDWADNIWDKNTNTLSGSLSLYMIDHKLYKSLKIKFRNNVVGVFTDETDNGWIISDRSLTKTQKRLLKEQGNIIIKRYR